jgi:hypothetical protein
MNNDEVAPTSVLAALDNPGAVPASTRYPLTAPAGAVQANMTELPSTLADRFVGDAGTAPSGAETMIGAITIPSAIRATRSRRTLEIENTQRLPNSLFIDSIRSVGMWN